MVSAPCKNCEDRHVGCHSECDRYKKFKEEHESEKAVIREIKDKRNALNDFRSEQIQKVTRKGKRR